MKLTTAEHEMFGREYERIAADLVANETMGDARVAGFMSVWVAATAAVGYLLTTGTSWTLRGLVCSALVALGVNGLVLLRRLVQRNSQTDRLTDALVRLRRALLENQTGLFNLAAPWKPGFKGKRELFDHPGLLHFACTANACILPMVSLTLFPAAWWAAVALLFPPLIGQFVWIDARNESDANERKLANEAFHAALEKRRP